MNTSSLVHVVLFDTTHDGQILGGLFVFIEHSIMVGSGLPVEHDDQITDLITIELEGKEKVVQRQVVTWR
jgi:hypothetical protein